MASTSYDILGQSIVSSLLVVVQDNDPFFNPSLLNFTGFSSNGFFYDDGVKTSTQASWFLEAQSPTRGPLPSFPTAALVLLSSTSLSIFDATNTSGLALWMQAVVENTSALANNFNNTLVGFTPSGLSYATGIISVIYTPDAGSTIQSTMVVNFDFTQDDVYLYVAVTP
jgi:hypothetical protein